MATLNFRQGNILDADTDALVNTVNIVGIMGKGVALQFRQAYPANYEAYRRACRHGEVQPGRMFVFDTGLLSPRYIVNFPTKVDWRSKSRLEYIESGLVDLVEVIRSRAIQSISVPPLGCGSGGLDWKVVRPRIEDALKPIPNLVVILFEPTGSPRPEDMPVHTRTPDLTLVRAGIVGLIGSYAVPGYRVTMLEVEKLAYFLQEAGEPLKLQFAKGPYGPYSEVLHHVLRDMEGHYVRGYGDRTGATLLRVVPGSPERVAAFLEDYPESVERLERVANLIEGFETPYGMELLATVHWVLNEIPPARNNLEATIAAVHAWSERKRNTFAADHIREAWQHLRESEWIPATGNNLAAPA